MPHALASWQSSSRACSDEPRGSEPDREKFCTPVPTGVNVMMALCGVRFRDEWFGVEDGARLPEGGGDLSPPPREH